MNTYFSIVVLSEWVAFIAALFLLYHAVPRWRLFIPWLFVTLAAETIGWWMWYKLGMKNNGLPFNINLLLTAVFEIWFLTHYASKRMRKAALFCLLFISGFAIWNLCCFQGFSYYNTITEVLLDLMLSLLSFHVLYLLATGDENTPSFISLDYFWVTIGLLFVSLGNAILYDFQSNIYQFGKAIHFNLGNFILSTLNIIFYSCLVIAFYCRWKMRKSLSASL